MGFEGTEEQEQIGHDSLVRCGEKIGLINRLPLPASQPASQPAQCCTRVLNQSGDLRIEIFLSIAGKHVTEERAIGLMVLLPSAVETGD